MPTYTLALLAMLSLLTAPAAAIAQQGPRIDVLTGEPVKPRSEHPRPEPQIFNAPHAPRQEHRSDNPPIEIYVAPQIGGMQQDQFSSGTGIGPYQPGQRPQVDPYAARRLPPDRGFGRRLDNGYPR
ncbi:MAG: hypothetical protein EOO66_11225 [Methylobacterium sp.]|nr:MAG: hypothetical protein EOO66_11225 [Methylobacterium sp.]